MNRTMIISDKVFAALGIAAAYGVIAKGAWWHIPTVIFASALVEAFSRDAKKESGSDLLFHQYFSGTGLQACAAALRRRAAFFVLLTMFDNISFS